MCSLRWEAEAEEAGAACCIQEAPEESPPECARIASACTHTHALCSAGDVGGAGCSAALLQISLHQFKAWATMY